MWPEKRLKECLLIPGVNAMMDGFECRHPDADDMFLPGVNVA